MDHIYSVPAKTQPTTGQAIEGQESSKQQIYEKLIESTTSSDTTIDSSEYLTNDQDYERRFQRIKLTTPSSSSFDAIHHQYKQSTDDYEDTKDTISNTFVTPKFETHTSSNLQIEPNGNSTNERNATHYLDVAEVESSSYSISTNDIRNNENRATSSDANLSLPSSSEVWALAAMKKEDYVKEQRGKALNVTSTKEDLKNNTIVTKQLADWASVMTDGMFANHSITNTTKPNRGSLKHPTTVDDSTGQENQVVEAQTVLPPPGFNAPSETIVVKYADETKTPDAISVTEATGLEENIQDISSTEREISIDMSNGTGDIKGSNEIFNGDKHLDTKYINSTDTSTVTADSVPPLKPEIFKNINIKISTQLPVWTKPNTKLPFDSDINNKLERSTDKIQDTNEIPITTSKNIELDKSTPHRKPIEITLASNLTTETDNKGEGTKIEDPSSNITLSSNSSQQYSEDTSIEHNLIVSKINTKPTEAVKIITSTSKTSSQTTAHSIFTTISSSVFFSAETSSTSTTTTTAYDLEDDLDFTTLSSIGDEDDDIEDLDSQVIPPSSQNETLDHVDQKTTTEKFEKDTIKPTDSTVIIEKHTTTEKITTTVKLSTTEKMNQTNNSTVFASPNQNLPQPIVIVHKEAKPDINAIIAASASVVGVICLVLLVGFLVIF